LTDERNKENAAYGQALFEDMLERFVRPEAERRLTEGTLSAGDEIHRFQILFPDGEPAVVRFNSEVGGRAMVRATRAIAVGEDVTVADFDQVSEYTPCEEDAGIPHVSAFVHRDGWSIVFQFSYGHPSRFEYLTLADDFLTTAHEALAGGRLGPFFENGFAACELMAKAELLSARPTVDLVLNRKTGHGWIRSVYATWANLGNSDARYPKLLQRLENLRYSARYLRGGEALNLREAEEVAEALREMRAHVQGRADGTMLPEQFFVYATRDLKGGMVVRRDDFALWPPKNDTT
jgi:hypothetical protein